MNSIQSITSLLTISFLLKVRTVSAHTLRKKLAITYLDVSYLIGVNVKGQHLWVFHPEIKEKSPRNLLKYMGFLIYPHLFITRSLIISIGFISLVFIYSYQH